MAAEHHEIYPRILGVLQKHSTNVYRSGRVPPEELAKSEAALRFGGPFLNNSKVDGVVKPNRVQSLTSLTRDVPMDDTEGLKNVEGGVLNRVDSLKSDYGQLVNYDSEGQFPVGGLLVFHPSFKSYPVQREVVRNVGVRYLKNSQKHFDEAPGIGSSGRSFFHLAQPVGPEHMRMEAVYPTPEGIKHVARVIHIDDLAGTTIYAHPDGLGGEEGWSKLGAPARYSSSHDILSGWKGNHGDCYLCGEDSREDAKVEEPVVRQRSEGTVKQSMYRDLPFHPGSEFHPALARMVEEDAEEGAKLDSPGGQLAKKLTSMLVNDTSTGLFDTEGWERLRNHASYPVQPASGSSDGRAWHLRTEEDGRHVLQVLEPSALPEHEGTYEHQLVTLVRHPGVDGARPRRRWTMTTTYPKLGDGNEEMWKALGSPASEGSSLVHQSFSHMDNHGGVGDLAWWRRQSHASSARELRDFAFKVEGQDLDPDSSMSHGDYGIVSRKYPVPDDVVLGSASRKGVPDIDMGQVDELVRAHLPSEKGWFLKNMGGKSVTLPRRATSPILSGYKPMTLDPAKLAGMSEEDIQDAALRGVREEAAAHIYKAQKENKEVDPKSFNYMNAAIRGVHRALVRSSMSDKQKEMDEDGYLSIYRKRGSGYVYMTTSTLAHKLADVMSQKSEKLAKFSDAKVIGRPKWVELHQSAAFRRFTPHNDMQGSNMYGIQAAYFMDPEKMGMEPNEDRTVWSSVMHDGSTATAHLRPVNDKMRVHKLSVTIPDALIPEVPEGTIVHTSFEREYPEVDSEEIGDKSSPIYTGRIITRMGGLHNGRRISVSHEERAVDRKAFEGEGVLGSGTTYEYPEGRATAREAVTDRGASLTADNLAKSLTTSRNPAANPAEAVKNVVDTLTADSEPTSSDEAGREYTSFSKVEGEEHTSNDDSDILTNVEPRHTALRHATRDVFQILRKKLREVVKPPAPDPDSLSHLTSFHLPNTETVEVYDPTGDNLVRRERTGQPVQVSVGTPMSQLAPYGVLDVGGGVSLKDSKKSAAMFLARTGMGTEGVDEDGNRQVFGMVTHGGARLLPKIRTSKEVVDGREVDVVQDASLRQFPMQSDPHTLWYAHHPETGLMMEEHVGEFPEGHPRHGETVTFTDSSGKPILRPRAFLDRGAAIKASLEAGGGHVVFPATEGDPRVGTGIQQYLEGAKMPSPLRNIEDEQGDYMPRQYSRQDELDLIREIQSGNSDARADFLSSMEPFLLKMSKLFNDRMYGTNQNQLMEAGRQALNDALETYDPEFKTPNGLTPKFVTYAAVKVRGAMDDRNRSRVGVERGGDTQEGITGDMLSGPWNMPTQVGVGSVARAMARSCPSCGAKENQPCTTAKGKKTKIHVRRVPEYRMVKSVDDFKALAQLPEQFIESRSYSEGLAQPEFFYGSTPHRNAVRALVDAKNQFYEDVAQSSFDNAPGDAVGEPFEKFTKVDNAPSKRSPTPHASYTSKDDQEVQDILASFLGGS